MKGLLLKDFYMMKQYCRAFLLIAVVFIAASLFSGNKMFFMLYPCLLAGLIPVTLYSYDEREKWCVYSATLPYTATQLVSAKYVFGLLLSMVSLVVVTITQMLKLAEAQAFTWESLLGLLAGTAALGLLTPSILLPLLFKLGAEKGRIAYFIVIIVICGVGGSLQMVEGEIAMENSMLVYALTGVGILAWYALSWRLSVSFYRKRQW